MLKMKEEQCQEIFKDKEVWRKKLSGAKKRDGIDKDDFMKVAQIAKIRNVTRQDDIPSDTDPRENAPMMAGIV